MKTFRVGARGTTTPESRVAKAVLYEGYVDAFDTLLWLGVLLKVQYTSESLGAMAKRAQNLG